jgi:16S rRNA (guanine966-N2)-methyltransferase
MSLYIIGGEYRGRRLASPNTTSTRPTSSQLREAFFNICQSCIRESTFLDLFAGSGAVGFEALSRGAAFVTFVESNRDALRCIEENIRVLGVQDRAMLLKGDVFSILNRLEQQKKQYAIIYADPPYRTLVPHSSHFYSVEMIQWMDKHQLLLPGGSFFVEEDFQFQPKIVELSTFFLKTSRRFGQSALQHYQKSTI